MVATHHWVFTRCIAKNPNSQAAGLSKNFGPKITHLASLSSSNDPQQVKFPMLQTPSTVWDVGQELIMHVLKLNAVTGVMGI